MKSQRANAYYPIGVIFVLVVHVLAVQLYVSHQTMKNEVGFIPGGSKEEQNSFLSPATLALLGLDSDAITALNSEVEVLLKEYENSNDGKECRKGNRFDNGWCGTASPLRPRGHQEGVKEGLVSYTILQELLIRLLNTLQSAGPYLPPPTISKNIVPRLLPFHDVPYGPHGNDGPKLYCAAWLQLLARSANIVHGPRCLEWGVSYTSRWFTNQCTEPYDMRFSEELTTGQSEPSLIEAENNGGTPGFLTAIDDEHLAAVIPSNFFDTIFCTFVLEHVRYPWIAVQQLYRITKPKGTALVTAPFLYAFHGAPSDHYRYTACGLWRLLESAGFCVEEIMAGGGAVDVAGMALGMSVPAFGRDLGSMEYLYSRNPKPGVAHSVYAVVNKPDEENGGACVKRTLEPELAEEYTRNFHTTFGDFGDFQCGE